MNKNSKKINFLILIFLISFLSHSNAEEEKSLSLGAHMHIFLMKLIGKHNEVNKIQKVQSSSSTSEEDRVEYIEPQSHPLIRSEYTRRLKCLKVANLIHCN